MGPAKPASERPVSEVVTRGEEPAQPNQPSNTDEKTFVDTLQEETAAQAPKQDGSKQQTADQTLPSTPLSPSSEATELLLQAQAPAVDVAALDSPAENPIETTPEADLILQPEVPVENNPFLNDTIAPDVLDTPTETPAIEIVTDIPAPGLEIAAQDGSAEPIPATTALAASVESNVADLASVSQAQASSATRSESAPSGTNTKKRAPGLADMKPLNALGQNPGAEAGTPPALKDTVAQTAAADAETGDADVLASEMSNQGKNAPELETPNQSQNRVAQSPDTAMFKAEVTAEKESPAPQIMAAGPAAPKAPTEILMSKPTPEVTIQVPQQRADMAAKQVGLELAKQVKNGDTQFTVRMDPPELGKLDVRLTINKAGEVQANIFVEREATLELLAKDMRALERGLNEAGLKADQNAFNLNLKQDQDEAFKNGNAQVAGNAKDGGDEGDGAEDAVGDVIDGATLAQIQLASGRPLDVRV